jgi:hypothetical protein
VVDTRVTQATGTAAREAAVAMAEAIPGQPRATLGADMHDDPQDFGRERRAWRLTPHVAQETPRRARAVEGRTTRQPGAAGSQRNRNGVEDVFGWRKTVGRRRPPRHRGVARVGGRCTGAAAGYTSGRLRTLAAVACTSGGTQRPDRPCPQRTALDYRGERGRLPPEVPPRGPHSVGDHRFCA